MATASVAGDNGNPRVIGQPCLCGGLLPVREERGDPAPFEIADDGAVAVIAAPGPVIDADDAQRLGRKVGMPAHDPQKRILAYRQHQPPGQARCGPSAQSQPEVMGNALEPDGAPGMAGDHIRSKAFSEDLPPTPDSIAAEAPCPDQELDRSTGQRQIRHAPGIVAMHP